MEVTLMIYVDCKSKYVRMDPNGDHIPKPGQDREMFEGWSMLLGATPQTSWDSAAYALLPGPSAMARRHITGSKALPD